VWLGVLPWAGWWALDIDLGNACLIGTLRSHFWLSGVLKYMSKRGKLILAALTVIYLLGYLGLRESHYIVHRSSYYTDAEGVVRTSTHFVQTGSPDQTDPSVGTVLVQLGVTFIYLPPISVERIYWYVAEPVDSEWPYTAALEK